MRVVARTARRCPASLHPRERSAGESALDVRNILEVFRIAARDAASTPWVGLCSQRFLQCQLPGCGASSTFGGNVPSMEVLIVEDEVDHLDPRRAWSNLPAVAPNRVTEAATRPGTPRAFCSPLVCDLALPRRRPERRGQPAAAIASSGGAAGVERRARHLTEYPGADLIGRGLRAAPVSPDGNDASGLERRGLIPRTEAVRQRRALFGPSRGARR
jgi:hypothetical protein